PEDLDLPRLVQADLHGGNTAEEASAIFRNVLDNTATPAQLAVVSANAGMAIHCMKPEQSIADCIAEARESISSGRARQSLERLLN
ncbi:MAG: anthranilate phosphoribosyltransferase, partial [Sinomicrobium sp.]|nr:anthranilate phosphoribosyltransferase [Sinomicrobium sp.]